MKITAEEIESLEKIVDYSIEREEHHYIEWITDEEGTEVPSLKLENIDKGHIYYNLRVIQAMLGRLKKETI